MQSKGRAEKARVTKNAIVTGATGKIGAAIAQLLARKGFAVCLVSRNPQKLAALIETIERLLPEADLTSAAIDLAEDDEIKSFGAEWQGAVDVLVNNAACAPPEKQVNSEGIELQFAVNVLSYVRMTEYLKCRFAPGARIVNVASYWAGALDIDDLQFERRAYDNDEAYRQSKQANRMLSVAYANEFAAQRVAVNACHPGDVNSKLSNDLGFGGSESPAEGAKTPVWLAVAKEVEGVTGKYFARCAQVKCEFSADARGVEALYRKCLGFVSR